MGRESYPDKVKELFNAFVQDLPLILGDKLFGIYVYGSLSYGGFDINRSDIDVVIVTESTLDNSDLDSLGVWFDKLTVEQALSNKLEVAFAVLGKLFNEGKKATETPRFADSKFEREKISDGNNPITWFNIRKTGLALFGPDPKEFVPEIDREVLLNTLKMETEYIKTHDDLVNNEPDKNYVILTLCRIFFTLKTGDLTDKKKAGEWALENIADKYHSLISTALSNLDKESSQLTPVSRESVEDFVDFTLSTLN